MEVFSRLYNSIWRMSTAVSNHSGTGPLSLMSCVRESSPPQDLGSEYEPEKTVSTKKRFWNPRKWFKRKNNKVADDVVASNDLETKEGLRSRSTSELSEPEEAPKRRSGVPMHPGLSVSHDSVFHSPHSGSEIELEGTHSASSLSVTAVTSSHSALGSDRLQTELIERLRLRRGRGDTSEDDEGLPRSPCNSPTATEKTANKDHPTKSHSTCSEGSLISMGSSEIDEDSSGQQSHHSSKVSLQDKKSFDGDLELENVQSSSTPLNHSAAHHRVSVRPSRRYGAPRKRRNQQISTTALPTTLEVNEETSIRSVTPEITIREAVTDLYTHSASASKRSESRYPTVNQLKCSSLPPGLASPNSDGNKLHRSRSNAGTKSQGEIGTLGEEDEGNEKKNESFLGKLFPIRRSGKKKRSSKEEKDKVKSDERDEKDGMKVSSPIDIERRVLDMPPKPFPRSGPASRQRVAPNDIPASPELGLRNEEVLIKSSPEKTNIPSPLHLELESKLQQRMTKSSSPTSSLLDDKKHFIKHEKKTSSTEIVQETNKSKVIIAGLSQFQKKTLIHNQQVHEQEEEKSFKSLTNFGQEENESFKPVIAKSHSFKVIKNQNESNPIQTKIQTNQKNLNNDKPDVVKSNSFEGISNINSNGEKSKTEIVDFKIKSESKFGDSSITISSGPSHKAIVSIGSTNVIKRNEEIKREEVKIVKDGVKSVLIGKEDIWGEKEKNKSGIGKVKMGQDIKVGKEDDVKIKREDFKVGIDDFNNQKDKVGSQIEGLKSQKDEFISNKDGIQVKKDGIYVKKDGIQVQKDGIQIQKEEIKIQRGEVRIQKEGVKVLKEVNLRREEIKSGKEEIKILSKEKEDVKIVKEDSKMGKEDIKKRKEDVTIDEEIKARKEELKIGSKEEFRFAKDLQINKDNIKSNQDNSRISKDDIKMNKEDFKGNKDDIKTNKEDFKGNKDDFKISKDDSKMNKDDFTINKEVIKMNKEEPKIVKENFRSSRDDFKFQDFKSIKEDSKIVKEDIKTIKENSKIIKEDSKITKEDFKIVKEDSRIIKDDSKNFKEDFKTTKEDSKPIKEDFKPLKEDFKLTELKSTEFKEHLSITKVQVKKESTQVIKTSKIPEFMNVQLHKVEKPTNNVVLSTTFTKSEEFKTNSGQFKPKTPPILDDKMEQTKIQSFENDQNQKDLEDKDLEKQKQNEKFKPEVMERLKDEVEIESVKTENVKTENIKTENVRKFSKEDIEIIEKTQDDKNHTTTALVTITTMSTPPKAFKKPDNLPLKKTFVPINSDKPILKVKSSSLDMVELKSDKDDKPLLKPEEKVELRPKTHSANDITDTNQVTYRRKSIVSQKKEDEPELMKVFARRSLKLKDSESEALSQQVVKMIEEEKEAAKSRDSDKENQSGSPPEERKKRIDPEVTLRKPIVNNKISATYQRTVSLNQKTNEVNNEKIHKQYSLVERPKTEWIKNQDEIILEKGVFIEEDKPKNFNQRMAEWEKRTQAVRKTSP